MLKGKLTISRPFGSRANTNPHIRIVVRDDVSHIEFLKLEIPLANFAECLTGLSEMDCEFDVHGTHNVGKKKEMERVTVLLSHALLKERGICSHDKMALEKYLKDDPDHLFHKPGWHLDNYLRTQSSVVNLKDAIEVNARRYRWVDESKKETT